jgi:hypothetical protein
MMTTNPVIAPARAKRPEAPLPVTAPLLPSAIKQKLAIGDVTDRIVGNQAILASLPTHSEKPDASLAEAYGNLQSRLALIQKKVRKANLTKTAMSSLGNSAVS